MFRNAFARNSAKDDNNKKLLTASALSSRDATDVIATNYEKYTYCC